SPDSWQRADDWIRTSMVRITGAAPFCIEPRRRFSRSARIRTLCGNFGDCLLSQEHAPDNQGSLEGVEPSPSGSRPAVQIPLHHSHHQSISDFRFSISDLLGRLPSVNLKSAIQNLKSSSPGWTRTTDLSHVKGTSWPLNDGTIAEG